MEIEADIATLARRLVAEAMRAGWRVATAESCTGGLVAGAITDIEGSSAVLDRGFITYSNKAKTDLVGVPDELLAQYGAVSEPVARAMAEGALRLSQAHVSVAITGIAGPGGGSAEKPVGLVHFAVAGPKGVSHREERFGRTLSRQEIRRLAVETALRLLTDAVVAD